MTVNVLGTEYIVCFVSYQDDPYFKDHEVAGYCAFYSKNIVICKMKSHPDFDDPNDQITATKLEKETLRHELIHAYLYESGLNGSAYISSESWARNEEMIDFFAIQGQKIMKTWQDANCL